MLAGILAAFGSHQLLHVYQLNLINIGFLALLLAVLHRFFGPSPRWVSALLVGITFALNGLSSAYFAVAAAVLALAFSLGNVRRFRSRDFCIACAAAVAVGALPMWPYMRAFTRVQETEGLEAAVAAGRDKPPLRVLAVVILAVLRARGGDARLRRPVPPHIRPRTLTGGRALRHDGAVSPSAASGLPAREEAAPYYFKYIDRITNPDVVHVLDVQLPATLDYLRSFSEEGSLHRYAPGKWSVRGVLGHVNDCERLFLSRAFWFARGFSSGLPSFDQNVCASAAAADSVAWADHVEDFRVVRLGTLSFFRTLPKDAWTRRGVASDNPFTVRALAYLAAGHLEHHVAILRESYARPSSS